MRRLKIRRSILILAIHLTVFAGGAVAQEYLWPTDASRHLTSSFAEFRGDHFHAGLDIKTWGKEGYRVFATRDGYIWKVRISPFGYGKVIYQKLDTGEIAVYAHLQRFAPVLEGIMRREQRRKKHYTVTRIFAPRTYPVKKGDLIAYTGRTGIGYPHLHFEIRADENTPTNPLLKGFRVQDSIPPVVTELAILPLNIYSQIDGWPIAQVYKLQKVGNATYAPPKPIQIWGVLGLAINTYDRANGVTNKFAIYRIRVYLDDEEIFESVYRKFTYQQTNQIVLDRNYWLLAHTGKLFYNLYLEPGNLLPFYQRHKNFHGALYANGYADSLIIQTDYLNWLLPGSPPFYSYTNLDDLYLQKRGGDYTRVSPGQHNLHIVVEDFFGNRSFVQVPILVAQKQKPQQQWLRYSEQNLPLIARNLQHRNWYEYDPLYGWQRSDLPAQVLSAESDGSNGKHFFPGKRSREFFLVEEKNDLGVNDYPVFLVPENVAAPLPEFRMEIAVDDPFTVVDIASSGPCFQPLRLLMKNRRVGTQPLDLIAHDARRFTASVPSFDLANDSTLFVLIADDTGDTLALQRTFYRLVQNEREETVISPDNNLRLQFAKGVSNQNIYIRIERFQLGQLPVPVPGDSIAPAYRIGPGDVPLLKPVKLNIRIPRDIPEVRQVGIYVPNGKKGKWNFVSNQYDADGGSLTARVRSFGTFVLLRDTQPPAFQFVFPRPGQTITTAHPTIKIRFSDDLSGVGNEDDFRLTLDGKFCIAELDPELKTVFYRVEARLAPGKHSLSFRIRDRAGNESRRTISFIVKGKQ